MILSAFPGARVVGEPVAPVHRCPMCETSIKSDDATCGHKVCAEWWGGYQWALLRP